ncbi:MAG: hypothetical protein H6Q74_1065 [Firmicutes bacterium]|nr:hypothetical protein [Bacillota bacterium]
MMSRLRFVLILALVGGVLTTIFALYHDVRTTTIVYRALFSVILFGAIGYLLISIIERFLKKPEPEILGQHIELSSDNAVGEIEQNYAEKNDADMKFNPFTPEQFDRISDKG